jgi:hypothetical protein
MKFLPVSAVLIVLLISCHSDSEEKPFEELPIFTPNIVQEFESLGDDIFFSHLGYNTVLLDDGSIFLPDRELEKIFKVSYDGDLISTIAYDGRGPGEIQDVNFMSRSYDNTIIVYDQINKKVLRFSALGEFIEEFILPPWEKGTLSEVYELDENHLVTVYRSFDFLRNPDLEPEAYMVVFDKSTGKYTQHITISDRSYARTIIDGQPRGGRIVPYSAEHLRYFNHINSKFYSFWTQGQTIACLTSALDTTQTITFELSQERLSTEEVSAIREDLPVDLWHNMEPLLPEYKAIADDLIIDEQNNFWLKLNYRSEYQKWLILSESGDKLAIVQLPKGGMLTHASDHHLGFRLDDHIFALFEPVKL